GRIFLVWVARKQTSSLCLQELISEELSCQEDSEKPSRKKQKPAEPPEGTLQPVERPAGCAVCSGFPAL
ncbi:hypothetical protein LEMLEM_LOCUS5506, partial [Lemmus lemmus]